MLTVRRFPLNTKSGGFKGHSGLMRLEVRSWRTSVFAAIRKCPRHDETQQRECSPQHWEARGDDLPIRCLNCGWAAEFLGEAPAA